MKRKIAVLIALILVCLAPVTAFAEGTDASPSVSVQAPTGEPTAEQGSIYLDNQNIYQGMDKAYQSGYSPLVSNGTAVVVLPLLANIALKDNSLTVTPNLGTPGTSPFVFTNYQKTVTLANQPVNGGNGTVEGYLVRFDLALASGRVNGSYPIVIDAVGQLADGSPVNASFTEYVTITDGKDPNAPTPTPTPQATETPTSEPKVIVFDSVIDHQPVKAGEDFAMAITLKNTSSIKSVQNMTVTATSDCTTLLFNDKSSTFYFNKLAKGGMVQMTLHLKADMTTAPGTYHINLAMGYDDPEAKPLTGAGTAEVSIGQDTRVEMDAPQMPKNVNVGDNLPMQLNVMNLSRAKVYNVRCVLNVPGLNAAGSAYIGSLEAGTAGQGTLNIFVGTKDTGDSGPYGLAQGKITLSYEDQNGKQYSADYDVSTTIDQPAVQTSTQRSKATPETASEWWISLLITGGVIGGLAALYIIKKRRGLKKDEKI